MKEPNQDICEIHKDFSHEVEKLNKLINSFNYTRDSESSAVRYQIHRVRSTLWTLESKLYELEEE